MEREPHSVALLIVSSTTATIQPKSLVNAGHSGKPGESKMVDFAIYLEPDQAMLEAMRSLAARKPYDVTSVNHTWHAPLITRPISVNIETKRSGEGWSAAAMQLGIWVGAQFSKLEQLVNDIGQGIQMIPFLPLIVVQGHDWYFLAASQGENGQTVCLQGPVSLSLSYRLSNSLTVSLEQGLLWQHVDRTRDLSDYGYDPVNRILDSDGLSAVVSRECSWHAEHLRFEKSSEAFLSPWLRYCNIIMYYI